MQSLGEQYIVDVIYREGTKILKKGSPSIDKNTRIPGSSGYLQCPPDPKCIPKVSPGKLRLPGFLQYLPGSPGYSSNALTDIGIHLQTKLISY